MVTQSRSLRRRSLAAGGAVYLAAQLWVSSHFATWTDEEYTLATTARGPAYAFVRAMTYELQAPLYFVLLSIWREVDSSVWFARLFSILCATAFFFALAAIARSIDSDRDPLPFALLAAINPFVLNAALEIRLYSFALLLSSLMWLAFERGFVRGRDARSRLAFVALSIVGIYVQYFLAFMLVGFAARLVFVRPSALRAFVAYGAVVALAAVPLAVAARAQFGGYSASGPPLLTMLRVEAVHPMLDFVFPYPGTWIDIGPLRGTYYAIVASCAAIVIWGRPRFDAPLRGLVACTAAIELTYLAVVAFLGVHLDVRYFIALFVPVAATAYALFCALRRGPRRTSVIAFAPALLTVLIVVGHYRFLAQANDWKRVTAFLTERATAGDVIAIFPPDATPAFERVYRGSVAHVPFPRPYSTEHYSVEALSIQSPADAMAAFARLHTYRRVWLVDAENCYPEQPLFGCDQIPKLAARVGSLERWSFFQSTVYEFAGASARQAQAGPDRIRQVGQSRKNHVDRL